MAFLKSQPSLPRRSLAMRQDGFIATRRVRLQLWLLSGAALCLGIYRSDGALPALGAAGGLVFAIQVVSVKPLPAIISITTD